ncbi:MAG: XdhC family protein [Steroidobacteraceae bacterium]
MEILLQVAPTHNAPKVLATVVATAGSTYSKPGARMLILADGSHRGLLSGGCLEADLKIHAEQVLATGTPRAVEYDMRGPDDLLFGIGSGCEGAMRVLLEPAGPGSIAVTALSAARRASTAGIPVPLVTLHESADLPLGTYCAAPPLPPRLIAAAQHALTEAASHAWTFDAEEHVMRAFVQYLAPSPHLLICGAGPDAQPVTATALALGWRVTVVDHRPVYAMSNRFPGAKVIHADAHLLRSVVEIEGCHAAVVMSHHLASDAAYLREFAAAQAAPGYIGLLGPAARRERIAREVGAPMDILRSRIRGPVGIDIGAVTPEGIALAIISQIHGWLAGRDPVP